MKCIKNGVGIDYLHGHVYAGDVFQCPECLNSVVSTNKSASYDPEYKYFDFYLSMKSDQIKGISSENIKKHLDENFLSKLEISEKN
jgi:hypothetical protein